ncbi:hypothetical protein E2C01_092311 [Portunus trituberculatus]|uniref:Uncharacterized protein n=1 Tax=Portunus trituberculatus TaxID=210409 RepID=A0A5B7JRD8_PORTR|nr:hypothetical protein [Portunus trituberculatus]
MQRLGPPHPTPLHPTPSYPHSYPQTFTHTYLPPSPLPATHHNPGLLPLFSILPLTAPPFPLPPRPLPLVLFCSISPLSSAGQVAVTLHLPL